MLLNLLVSTIIAAASSVTPTGSVVTADNQIWMGVSCSAGTDHATLELYRSADIGQWGTPVLTVAQEGKSVIGGALFLDSKGRLSLFYTLTSGKYDGEGIIYMKTCCDPVGAPTVWDSPVKVGAGCVSGAPVVGKDGSLLLPVSLWGASCIDDEFKTAHPELDSRRGAFIYRSVDGGATWTAGESVLNVPERLFADRNNPHAFVSPDGSLNMVCRACDAGFLYSSRSTDNGATWSLPEKVVQNPHQNFALSRLNDGRLILVKNFKMDMRHFYCDRELYAYLSEDEGVSWYGGLRITWDAFIGEPVVSQSPAGDIYVACRKQNLDTSAVLIFKTTPEEIDASHPHRTNNIAAQPVVAFAAGKAAEATKERLGVYSEPRTSEAYPHNLRLCSYNIQRQGWGSGPKWDDRRESVIAEFKEHQWDIVGTQEASDAYIKDIIKGSGMKYDYVGNSAQFTKEHYRGGSEQFVIYRKDRFTVLSYDVRDYRLNKDKFVGANTNGESYGADYYKATFWVKFHDKKNNLDFYHVNLHYPVRTPSAQQAYTQLLLDFILEHCEGLPVVITGDFNCDERGWGCRYLSESGFINDSMTSLPVEQRKNWEYYSGGAYRPLEKQPKNYRHLDHVYYTPRFIEVLTWELDVNTVHDGKYASDHLPVTADLKFYK